MRLIDADALKADYGMKDDCKDCEKEIQGYVRECHYNAVYTKMDFCEWIDSAPTIEPQRKKGKWVDGRCGQCGYHAPYWPMASTYYESKYCPGCGAKMEEGD